MCQGQPQGQQTPKKAIDEFLQEHAELRAKLAQLSDFLQRERPEIGAPGYHRWASALARELVDLHGRLFRHFRDEERDGILDELEIRHPRASVTVQELKAEHPRILLELRELMTATLSYSEGQQPPDPRLRSRLQELLSHLAHHEERETDLIQRLDYRDFGGWGE